MKESGENLDNFETITMQFHPRAFAAFGSELVTNDAVAVTELVKNCYDAFAYSVDVEFGNDAGGEYIKISDDGLGMTKDVIKNSWAVIATPYKKRNPVIKRDGKTRYVSGNKGLGRFSAARLGRFIEIITKSVSGECIYAQIDWDKFTNSGNISDCKIQLKSMPLTAIKSDYGTTIKISGLSSEWGRDKINELQNGLARLISPFQEISDFSICISSVFYAKPVEIKPAKFIQNPIYKIEGVVSDSGDVEWKYTYAPKGKIVREKEDNTNWDEAKYGFDSEHLFIDRDNSMQYMGGGFSFEIRGWDLDTDSIGDVADAFDIGRKEIRGNISKYKGLSIYRDKVLVLPKSDASKDWLGLDLRRVSNIGKRISTSQIIGLINVTAEKNPQIKDTTDREKLVDTKEYIQFCKIVETIISILEKNRTLDKAEVNVSERQTLSDLISPLSSNELVQKVEKAVNVGSNAEVILDVVREYNSNNEKQIEILNERLTYYAQTASLGSVAVVILHEILTGMTVIQRFLKRVMRQYSPLDAKTEEYLKDAETSHTRLVEVAKSFAPLYRKDLNKQKNSSFIFSEVENSIRLVSGKKEAKNIEFNNIVQQNIATSLHPGELQTIFINLLDNAIYWIKKSGKESKKIVISVSELNGNHIKIKVSDTGTGIMESDVEKIFQPGITGKPFGIGMGLVIVTELLNNHGCKIATIVPGDLGGATFEFSLPIKK